MTLLSVQNLSVEYQIGPETVKAVNNVSFEVGKNERFGLVGESGCGKSTIVKAVIRLLPNNGSITEGQIKFKLPNSRIDLLTADQKTLRKVRWKDIAMISQSAMNALDPVYTIGEQIVEAIQLHEDMNRAEAMTRARSLINQVGMDDGRLNSYPHQLSGGMRQRCMIAMANALEPSIIVADEPTTALDVVNQDYILGQIESLSERGDHSLLVVSHDLSVIADLCDRVGVMYGGELVEVGPIEEIFLNPKHPYTLGLLKANPRMDQSQDDLITIKGQPPDLGNPPVGCNFYDRCPFAEEICEGSNPELTPRGDNGKAACFITDEKPSILGEYDVEAGGADKWEIL